MKRYFPWLSCLLQYGCGVALYFSGELSHHAAWSLIVAPVNLSPWELFKPFGLVYIGFIILELACLRPSLLHFVCSKIAGLYVLCLTILLFGSLTSFIPSASHTIFPLTAAAAAMTIAQICAVRLFYSKRKPELLWMPMVLSLVVMIFLMIILSFYPPCWSVFYDPIHQRYGREMSLLLLYCGF